MLTCEKVFPVVGFCVGGGTGEEDSRGQNEKQADRSQYGAPFQAYERPWSPRLADHDVLKGHRPLLLSGRGIRRYLLKNTLYSRTAADACFLVKKNLHDDPLFSRFPFPVPRLPPSPSWEVGAGVDGQRRTKVLDSDE